MANNKKSLHVKTGDRVIVTAGKDKGKIGNVKKAIPTEGKVLVEGANMVTKAQKPNPMAGIQGGLVKLEAPLDSSNVMVVCPSCEKPTKIFSLLEAGRNFSAGQKIFRNFLEKFVEKNPRFHWRHNFYPAGNFPTFFEKSSRANRPFPGTFWKKHLEFYKLYVL